MGQWCGGDDYQHLVLRVSGWSAQIYIFIFEKKKSLKLWKSWYSKNTAKLSILKQKRATLCYKEPLNQKFHLA